MTSIGCRVGPDRGGLRDTVPPFVAGGKSPNPARIMTSGAQSAVTRHPSAVNDAATLPRCGLRSARWRLMALLLVRRWVGAGTDDRRCRASGFYQNAVAAKCGLDLSLQSGAPSGRVAIPTTPRLRSGCTAAARQLLGVGGVGDTPSACRNSAHKQSDRNASADRIGFRGGCQRSGLARRGCVA